MFDKRIISIYIFFIFTSLHAQFGDSFPILKFDVDTVDFGIVNEGDTVIHDFWFTNVGTKDLVIRQAHPACGCTTPTYKKGAIKPGERGFIHVEFHSKGFGGQNVVKSVIILLVNGPENYAIFKAKIVKSTALDDIEKYRQESIKNLEPEKEKKQRTRRRRSARFRPLITPDF